MNQFSYVSRVASNRYDLLFFKLLKNCFIKSRSGTIQSIRLRFARCFEQDVETDGRLRDKSLFYQHDKSGHLTALLASYVDDVIVTTAEPTLAHDTLKTIDVKYGLSSKGEISNVLVLQVKVNREKKTIALHQDELIDEIACAMNVQRSSKVSCPTGTHKTIFKEHAIQTHERRRTHERHNNIRKAGPISLSPWGNAFHCNYDAPRHMRYSQTTCLILRKPYRGPPSNATHLCSFPIVTQVAPDTRRRIVCTMA